MPRPTFVAQPPFRLPKSKPKPTNSSNSVPILSLHTLSLAPFPPPTATPTSTPTPLSIAFPSATSTPFLSPPSAATPSKTVIVWFRADLRLHDHPALMHALDEAAAGPVVPVFIFDPRKYGKTAFGFQKTGRYRAKFLIDSVAALRQSLNKRGSDLVVRIGHPEHVLPQLANQIGAAAVFCHRDVSLEDTKLESALQSTLQRVGVDFQPMWSNTLYHIDDLPFPVDQLPDVYSTYREQIQANSQIRAPLSAPNTMPRLPRIQAGDMPSLSQLGLTEPRPQASAASMYVGGEKEALKRLSVFVEGASTERIGYTSAEHLGADFSCRISPWLALGCVSPRKIYADLAAAAPRAKQIAMYFDLVWRDFFRYITFKYNRAKLFKASPAIMASPVSAPAVAS